MPALDVELLLEEAGSFHAFQHKYIFLLGVPWSFCGALTMVHIFVAIPPQTPPQCPLLQNTTTPLPDSASSLMIEWGLLCGREYEADMLESAFMAGMVFGAGILGNVADRCGRLPTLNACALGAFVGGCWSTFAATYVSYLLSRVLTGFFVAGLGLVCFVLTSEILGQGRRVILVVSGTVLFALGVAGLSQIALLLKDNWRYIHFSVAVSSILLAFLPSLRESPHWLASSGQRQKALEVLRHIAATNDRVLISDPDQAKEEVDVREREWRPCEHSRGGELACLPTDPHSEGMMPHAVGLDVGGERMVGKGIRGGDDGDDAGGIGQGSKGSRGGAHMVEDQEIEGEETLTLQKKDPCFGGCARGGDVEARSSDARYRACEADVPGGPDKEAEEGGGGRGGEGGGGDGGSMVQDGLPELNAYAELWVLKVRLIASMLLWFACSFGYYGLSLSVGGLGGSIYQSSLANSLLELPSNLAAAVLVEHPAWGRRLTTGAACALGSLFCLLGSFASRGTPQVLAAAFAGKFFVTAAFAIAFLFGAELFPTGSRSSAMGLLSLSARLGGILAPFVPNSPAGQLLFAIPLALSALAMTRLPETYGRALPRSLHDIDFSKETLTPACCRAYQRMDAEEEVDGTEMRRPEGQWQERVGVVDVERGRNTQGS